MLEIACHAPPNRDEFWQAMVNHGVVTLDENGEPVSAIKNAVSGITEIDWVEIGDLVRVPAVLDQIGDIVTPAVMYNRHFVNLRGWGDFEAQMLAGKEQFEADGETLRWLFDRTNLTVAYPTLIEYQLDVSAETPRGYAGSSGIHFFDVADVKRRNVWA